VLLLAVAATGCSGSGSAGTATTSTTVAETTTTSEPPLEAGSQVFVYTPEVGQCFDRRQLEERPTTGPQQTDIVLLLDCGLPHDNEVIDVLEMPDRPRDYPGETAMRDVARASCTLRFATYIGRAYETSALEVGYYLPSSNEWESGARRLGCYVYDVDNDPLIGSMRGSAR
jgi:hypothetical protein